MWPLRATPKLQVIARRPHRLRALTGAIPQRASFTAMDRYRRISQFWSWLPAFRGVAEYESIHGAAAVLATSPSALSRTVKLLEDAVGEELFKRDKQALALTPLGARLLVVVRDAMRAIDDCIMEGRSQRPGEIVVGATTLMAASLIEAALLDDALAGAPPVRALMLSDDDIEPALLRGDVDMAIASAGATPETIEVRGRGTLRLGVYASALHPLSARAGAFVAADLAGERAVGASDGLRGTNGGASSCTVGSLASALLVCCKSRSIAVLPDAFVEAFGDKRVVRLCDAASALPLVVLTRIRLDAQTTPWLDALEQSIGRRMPPLMVTDTP